MKPVFLLVTLLFSFAGISQPSRPNVLMICVDDLRPDLGCYGNPVVHSLNIDELANRSTIFTNQFVVVPTCGPSRASMLTGRFPRSRQDLDNNVLEFRHSAMLSQTAPESFVEVLKKYGYYTVGIGKISHSPDGHIYKYPDPKGPELELPHSWDEMLFDPGKWSTGWNAFFAYGDGSDRTAKKAMVRPYEAADVEDEGYPDGLTAKLAAEKLKALKMHRQPFFLAVGFFKPHLPFTAPKKYWDLYDESRISLTPSPGIPQNVNKASLHESNEFNGYKLGDEKASLETPVSDAYARKLKHAYFACISYTDAQIGKVMAALKENELDKNTIVILWGDHGWHLGDDLVWGKHTIFEWALRSPLIIHSPGVERGNTCKKVVSSIDIYPTVLALCGVDAIPTAEGISLKELLTTPGAALKRDNAYSYFREGISVRTDRYRLTRYFRKAEPTIELYDHREDPFENRNIASIHPEIVKRLMPLLMKGDTGLYTGPADGKKADN